MSLPRPSRPRLPRTRKPKAPVLTPEQMTARIHEIDAWLLVSVRHEGNIDRSDRLEWHREERTRQRRERSKLVRRLRKLGIEVRTLPDLLEQGDGLEAIA